MPAPAVDLRFADPAGPGRERNDLLFTTGLRLTFSTLIE
jgi:hypothetical protein